MEPKLDPQPLNKILNNNLHLDILSKLWQKCNLKTHNLPVGVSDFNNLASKHSQYYVDKSLFIKEILQINSQGMNMILITRPSGWGKTVNLTMLKYFLNKQVDHRGVQINPHPYKNLFNGGPYIIKQGRHQRQVILPQLYIADSNNYKTNYLTRRFQGTCPVIFLEFGVFSGSDHVQIKRGILLQILKSYESHKYLQNTQKAGNYNSYRKQLQKIVEMPNKEINKEPIDKFIRALQIMLQNFHKSEMQCMVLIDDLDEPIHKILRKGGSLRQARNVALLIAQILNPITSSAKNLRIVATAKQNTLETLLSNYKQFELYDDKLFYEFGFTEDQVSEKIIPALFQKSQLTKKIKDFLIKQIVLQYGGYTCGIFTPTKIQPNCCIRYLQGCISSNQILKFKYIKDDLENSWLVNQFLSISGFSKIFDYHSIIILSHKAKNDEQNNENQPVYPLQFFLNKTNQTIQIAQINYLAYCHGLITGKLDVIGKFKILNPKLPNNSVTRAVSAAIIKKFRQEFGFNNFSPIDLTSPMSCKMYFEQMLNFCYSQGAEIDASFVSGAFYYRYQYSENKKFKTAFEQINSGEFGIIDTVYVPMGKEDQIYILNFRYQPQNQEDTSLFLSSSIYQILESTKLERAQKAALMMSDQIQQFIIRLILIMPDIAGESLEMTYLADDIFLSSKQLSNIVKNLNDKNIRQQWDRLRRLQLLKKGKKSLDVLHVLASHQMVDSEGMQDLIDLDARKKERMFKLNGFKDPLARKLQPKSC